MKKSHAAAQTLVIVLVFAVLFPVIPRCSSSLTPTYCSVDLHALSPLIDLNSSLYGLEVPATPSAVGDNFTVELHLRNATTANFPLGVNGMEVRLYFGSVLNYCQPTGFADYTGQPGGVLTQPVLQGITAGFYAADGVTRVSNPPYAGATYYEVAAASFGGTWNGEDGVIANITFQITKQPQGSEPSVNLPLVYSYLEVDTTYVDPITHETRILETYPDSISGNIMFDSSYAPPTNYSLMVQENPAASGVVIVRVNGVAQIPPYTFLNGTVVQAEATPVAGYSFSNWTLDGSIAGTANPINITMIGNHTITANFASSLPPPNLLPVTLTAEPRPLPPLLDINPSLYSLEIPPTQIAVGDRFVVDLHLRNATQDNVPLGLASLEVHFYFGNITGYLQPVGFTNNLGASDGVLNPAIQFSVLPKFYDTQGNEADPPYDNAVSYDVAASSTGMGWNGVDGLVAQLTFQITKQPQSFLEENTASIAMDYVLTSLNDSNRASIARDCVNATITLASVAEEIAITKVTLGKTVVGEGYSMNINVTVTNEGTIGEDFPVTVYGNASIIDSKTISLIGGNSTTMIFVRNTTGFSKGHYAITAVAETVPGETNATDNTYTAGSIIVTIPGDIDGNGRVGLSDLVLLAISIDSEDGQPKWNPNGDIDGSGVIDLSDLGVLAQNYAKHWN